MFPNNFHLTVPSTLQQSSSCPELTSSFLRLLGSYPINLTSDRLCRTRGDGEGGPRDPLLSSKAAAGPFLSAVYPVVG